VATAHRIYIEIKCNIIPNKWKSFTQDWKLKVQDFNRKYFPSIYMRSFPLS